MKEYLIWYFFVRDSQCFQVPNVMPIFCSLGCATESIQAQSPMEDLIAWWLSMMMGLLAPGQSPSRRIPLVGCQWLLIQYTCSYFPYLEALSSICNLRMHHAAMTRDTLNTGQTNQVKLWRCPFVSSSMQAYGGMEVKLPVLNIRWRQFVSVMLQPFYVRGKSIQ